jgi:hypothetical protein
MSLKIRRNQLSFVAKSLLICMFMLVNVNVHVMAANTCQIPDQNEERPTPSRLFVSPSPAQTCNLAAAAFEAISVSVRPVTPNPYGGSGSCDMEFKTAPYFRSTDYSCACDPPVFTVIADGSTEVTSPNCSTKRIGFFNGVANTEKSAIDSLNRLKKEFGTTYKKRPLEYELFYNQTACRTGLFGFVPCLEDLAEVFAQRNKELGGVLGDRWEIYWEMLAGRQNQLDSLTTGLLAGLRNQFANASNALLQLLDSIAASILNQLIGSFTKLLTLMSSPPTAADTAAHVAKISKFIAEGEETSGIVLVAHSQGNLFVNAAYKGFLATPNFMQVKKIKVVHIAPASPTLSGSYYMLADIDFVINGLRLSGANSVPPANISLPLSSADKTGHSFEGTYMDTTRNAYEGVKSVISGQLDQLKSYK